MSTATIRELSTVELHRVQSINVKINSSINLLGMWGRIHWKHLIIFLNMFLWRRLLTGTIKDKVLRVAKMDKTDDDRKIILEVAEALHETSESHLKFRDSLKTVRSFFRHSGWMLSLAEEVAYEADDLAETLALSASTQFQEELQQGLASLNVA